MPDLVVIVPSRGRPGAVAELIQAFEATCTADTGLAVALDADDPLVDEYRHAIRSTCELKGVATVSTRGCPAPSTMVKALNYTADELTVSPYPLLEPFAIGFMGDDHRPRTRGWDAAYLEALRELKSGIVYGDDLLQGRRLPTQCAMTADIVRTLGYMAPPSLTHMYVDNFWLTLGEQAQCIKYLPDVVVEHRHPVAGKAQWDEGYKRVNDPGMYAKDDAAFSEYCRTSLLGDVEKVRALRGAHV